MKTSSKLKWLCVGCKEDTHLEHFFVVNGVWFKVHNSKYGMMCVGCMEARLGRKLNKNDFTSCYINQLNYGAKSDRLRDRLTREEYT